LSRVIPLSRLRNEKFRSLICYPRFTEDEFNRRLEELNELSVKSLELTGEKRVFDFPALGKGYSSVVIVAVKNDRKRYALKIRRVDAGKADTSHEVEMLTVANRVGVGANLQGSTRNFILLKLVKGKLLAEWVDGLKGRRRKLRLKNVLRCVLQQCQALDSIGLDHGELSRASKHILIDDDDQPYLIDFEKGSTKRRVSNVTSVCQYLLFRGEAVRKIHDIIGKVDENRLIAALRRYKRKSTDENFGKLLGAIHLL